MNLRLLNKTLLGTLTLTSLLLTPTVHAKYVVEEAPKQPVQLFFNKLVKNPELAKTPDKDPFVKSITDFKFTPDSEVTFKLEIKNTTQNELNNIQIKDKIPDLLDFVSGPGSFDATTTRTLNISVDKLAVNETKSFEFKAKVKFSNNLAPNTPVCLTNSAEARVNELFTQSNADFCIENKVLSTTEGLPRTGVSNTVAIFALSTLSLFSAIYFLGKKTYMKGGENNG